MVPREPAPEDQNQGADDVARLADPLVWRGVRGRGRRPRRGAGRRLRDAFHGEVLPRRRRRLGAGIFAARSRGGRGGAAAATPARAFHEGSSLAARPAAAGRHDKRAATTTSTASVFQLARGHTHFPGSYRPALVGAQGPVAAGKTTFLLTHAPTSRHTSGVSSQQECSTATRARPARRRESGPRRQTQTIIMWWQLLAAVSCGPWLPHRRADGSRRDAAPRHEEGSRMPPTPAARPISAKLRRMARTLFSARRALVRSGHTRSDRLGRSSPHRARPGTSMSTICKVMQWTNATGTPSPLGTFAQADECNAAPRARAPAASKRTRGTSKTREVVVQSGP